MRIGVPKELKNSESRVAITPAGVRTLVASGHHVLVEVNAGLESRFSNDDYEKAGAEISSAQKVWSRGDLIVKVKEPLSIEWHHIESRHTIFTYFHFAADRELTEAMKAIGPTCIAYETVQFPSGDLPLLMPMSEIAGKLAPQEGAQYMDILLGGATGVEPASVVILGGGIAGKNAAKVALGMGARVTVLEKSPSRIHYLGIEIPTAQLVQSSREAILEHIAHADLVIGAVLVPGTEAPKLIRRDDLKYMRKGAVIVDIAVDQGGCVETIHPTTHDDPVYVVDDIVHYSVANMPGAVPRTSTLALTNATLPYITAIADKGWKKALASDGALLKGLNLHGGHVTNRGVADAFGMSYAAPILFI